MRYTPHLPVIVHTPVYVHGEEHHLVENPVCQEVPLEIRINGETYALLMRTPGGEQELAVGVCFTNELIASAADVTAFSSSTAEDSPYITSVSLTISSLQGKQLHQESLLKLSSGSVSNTEILENIFQHVSPIASTVTFSLSVLEELPGKLNACQLLRSKCGATHGAALFDQHGNMLACAEDVGRHNGLDKLIGSILLQKIETHDTLLMLSSRASFEMIQKAVRAAIPVVASVSAPTDLALNVADKLQCTYVSFLKRGSLYIYTHPWRFGLGEC